MLVLVVWFVLHSVFISVDGMSQPQRTADVAVVLGTTVHPSGTVTPWLEARYNGQLSCTVKTKCKTSWSVVRQALRGRMRRK